MTRLAAMALLVPCMVGLASCTPASYDPSPHALWTDPASGMSFAVVPTSQHPFLRDHDRELVVISPSGGVTRVHLYSEPGSGVYSNLYKRQDGDFVLIDMNGIWLTIGRRTGKVISCEWRWGEPTPRDYLGVFKAGKRVIYRFVNKAEGEEQPIYGFKDPSHPLLKD